MARKINWEKKCDALVKDICLAKRVCERCGNTSDNCQLHHHHIITRNNKAYRHCPENIVCLCASCHMLAPWSAHKNLDSFRLWLQTTDRWGWFVEHHVKSVEMIAGQEVEIYRPIKMKHIGDEAEYEILKAIQAEGQGY